MGVSADTILPFFGHTFSSETIIFLDNVSECKDALNHAAPKSALHKVEVMLYLLTSFNSSTYLDCWSCFRILLVLPLRMEL